MTINIQLSVIQPSQISQSRNLIQHCHCLALVHRKGIDECIHKEPAYPDVQILSLNTPFGDFNKIGKDERKSRKQKDELHDIIELDNFGLSENLPTN